MDDDVSLQTQVLLLLGGCDGTCNGGEGRGVTFLLGVGGLE